MLTTYHQYLGATQPSISGRKSTLEGLPFPWLISLLDNTRLENAMRQSLFAPFPCLQVLYSMMTLPCYLRIPVKVSPAWWVSPARQRFIRKANQVSGTAMLRAASANCKEKGKGWHRLELRLQCLTTGTKIRMFLNQTSEKYEVQLRTIQYIYSKPRVRIHVFDPVRTLQGSGKGSCQVVACWMPNEPLLERDPQPFTIDIHHHEQSLL